MVFKKGFDTKWIWGGKMWIGCIWHRLWSIDGLLCTRQ